MRASIIISALVAGALGHDRQAMMSRPSTAQNSTAAQVLPPKQDPWYSAPANCEHAAPGTVLKIRPAAGNLTSVQSNSSAAYNILYRTTDSRYNATFAVTTLFVPANLDGFNNNDKLLSYQIPYDSADLDASPSYALYSSPYSDIVNALGQGYYVSVPDYEGPLASFTAGVISGHATLDSIRAVLSSGFGLNTTSAKYAMWGYSGGALASEWAAELQIQYAPELNFAGAALGGLTPNVTSVLAAVSGSIEAGLVPAGILGLASQYPELEQYLTDNLKTNGQYNATGFLEARNYTLIEAIVVFAGQDITQYFANGAGTLLDPIPRSVINRDGIMGYHGVPQMPVFAYKAIMDEISPVNDADILIDRYCNIGATIRYDRNTVGSHTTESDAGRARALSFLNSVLEGTYNATGCQIQNVTVNSTSSS